MKIKIQLNDGYEEIIEVDEEEGEIKDLGSTKEMLQDRIEKLEKLNRDMSGDVAFYHEANKECQKTIEDLRDKAHGWEKRCSELEQDNRDLQGEHFEMLQKITEMGQELRDAQGQLDESVRKEAQLGLEANKLRDRIQEQDVTIAKYDDENRALHKKLEKYDTEAAKLVWKWDKGSTALTRWARAIHENAVAHGWWVKSSADAGESCADSDRPLPEILMLCVCELAESMEEYRNGKPLIYDGEDGKPEGIAVEMVDCMIRILDWMGHNGVDVDELLRKKHEFNKGRPYRHGGKKA